MTQSLPTKHTRYDLMSHLITLLLSFAALLWSASHLVKGASGIAAHYRLSPLLVGFTLVALGTSAPEIIIAIDASLAGLNDIAIGNAVGTNIANIGLVLGITALIKPLRIQPTLARREYPLLFLVMLFSYSLMLDGYFSVLDSCLFLITCLGFITYLMLTVRHSYLNTKVTLSFQQTSLRKHSHYFYILCFITGLIMLPCSAYFLIKSATNIAQGLGVSDLIIALTIVAFGSSLPELATSIIAVKKGVDDIAIGNILGTNIFNLLAVMIVPGAIHPSAISHALLWRDIPFMFAVTLLLLWFTSRSKKHMGRGHGALLILMYCCYITALFISALK
jgi:cation:H+ antiporter